MPLILSPISSLYPPTVPAEQGLHLGGAIGLRLSRSIAWIAVRATLTLTRAIVSLAGPVSPSLKPQRFLVAQPAPRAVTVVQSRSAYLRVHPDPRCVDVQSTTGAVSSWATSICERSNQEIGR